MSRRPNGEGSTYPYRNGWAAHVWITTPTGRRQRKSVYGKTREEVHGKWLRLHQQARRGPVAPVSPRLRDFLRRWLRETVKPNLSPTTAKNYEMFARLYIVPDLGNRPLDKLMVRDVQVWVNALRTRCQCCAQGKDAARAVPLCCAIGECCHEVASDWTIHQAWRVLRGALTQAMREDLVFRNVAALVRVPMPRRQKQPVWTVEEARRFLESARADDDPLYAAYVLLLTLGCGAGGCSGWRGRTSTSCEARRSSRGRSSGSTGSSCAGTPRRQARTRRCRCPRSPCGRSSGTGSTRTGGGSPPARRGATADSSSPPATATPSTPATSTATSSSAR